MATQSLHLNKDLRKSILQGHPWVFANSLQEKPHTKVATLGKLFDKKKDFLCWVMCDPHSPIAARVLSFDKNFSIETIQQKLHSALELRGSLKSDHTNCFRLINGEGDGLPGLVCDIYNECAVMQFDGQGPKEFWQTFPIAKLVHEKTNASELYLKPRASSKEPLKKLQGTLESPFPLVKEFNSVFKVDIEKGQKTGFFLDQRDNRKYLASLVKNKIVANLFSYTGGFSVYAGRGKAKKVFSIDISQKALDLAQENWSLNKLDPQKHQTIATDVFNFLSEKQGPWDVVIVDPPSMAHAKNQKESASQKYVDLFAMAARNVRKGGDLLLSSCSSHISFSDFYEICSQSMSKSRRIGQVLKISGQGADHPFPLACPEMRYLKFVHLKLF